MAVLLTATLALAQPRLAGPETPLALPAARYETEGRNEHPVAVGTSMGFLVFWESKRATEPSQLYVSRLDAAGNRIEPTGVPLRASARSQFLPAASRGLTSTLVVWQDGEPSSSDLSAVRVRDDGTVVDAMPLVVTSDATSQTEPAVAFDGIDWWVVFTQRAGAGDTNLRAVRVNEASGAVSSPFDLVTTAADQTAPSIAWDGARWLVAYVEGTNNGDIFLQRFEPTGVPSEARIVLEVSARPSLAPSIAAIAGRWTIGWEEPSTPTQVYVVRGAGAMSDSLAQFPSTNDQCRPHAYVNGAALEVVFHQAFAGFKRQPVPATGPFPVATLGNSGINGNANIAAAVSGTGDLLAVIVIPPSSGEDSYLRGTRFGGLDSLPISEGSAVTLDVSLLTDGPGAWAVYGERVATYDTYGQVGAQRVDATGVTSDAGVLVGWRFGVQRPSVASNGRRTLVAWPTYDGLFVAPWDRTTGPLLDAGASLTGARVQSRKAALAAIPDAGFLLAWSDDRAAMFESDFYFTRLDENGVVLDVAGRALRVGAGQTREVAVGFDGVDWLAATVDDLGRLELVRIDLDGTVRDLRALGTTLDAPAIAAGRDEALVLWSAPTDAGAQLLALRSFADGGWSSQEAITPPNASHRRPTARWASTHYVVAFDTDELDTQQVVLGELRFTPTATFSPALDRWVAPSDVFNGDLAVLPSGDVLVAGTHFALQGAALNSTRGFVTRFTTPPDAGTAVDAGGLDGGTEDAGTSTTDAGTSSVDAGSSTPDRHVLDVACGCTSLEGLCGFGLILLIRRRRG